MKYGNTNMEKNNKILIVDDEEQNIRLMSSLLEAMEYKTEAASNGEEAIKKIRECKPDLVLLDIMMPGMDGFEVCTKIKESPDIQHIPVVMVTALADRNSKLKGLDVGANDFLTKPIDRSELMLRVKNLLKIKEFEDFMIQHNQMLEIEVEKRTHELRGAMNEIEKSHKATKDSYVETIYRLTLAAEYKDEDTAVHIKRISHYCRVIALKLGAGHDFIDTIFYASPMHDIGKIGIPDSILLKPGKLSDDEFGVMKKHTTIGAKILKESNSHYLSSAEDIALSHHERWDGRGYPHGLKKEEIPLMGRIMNLVDQYDALRSKRPYKSALSHEKTCEILIKGDGRTMPGHFDPGVLESFASAEAEFNDIFENHS